MTFPKTADIIIIGGGVMGASTAYHLAARGQKNILLLEKEEFFGLGATGRCAGGVRYQFSTEINVELSKKSLPMFENFKAEIGQDINYQKCGYIFALTRPQDVDYFRHNIELQQRLGVQTEWLTGDEIRQRLPLMRFEDAIAGTFNSKDGLVDPNSVVMGYINAGLRIGVIAENNVEVTGIQVVNGEVRGVITNQGIVSSPIIVNACGPWSGLIGDMAGVKLPITPLRRQMLTTSSLPEVPEDFPFVIDFAQSLYFHREGDGLLTGMSNQNEQSGFDQNVDEEFELVNLESAISRMPLLEHAGLASHWAGLYEVTPDAHPIFGRTPVKGFHVVAGFSGHGFMHGPISGKLMAEYILDGKFETLDVSMLDLARFEEDRLIKEYNVV
ncbi:MAG: FAD dependent oxidoreductase [Chloroflexi bacterium GWB2_49_20]|nr:MAG: FAD dependent oxidoreductase [Chloroflexi bacterium GWB2_49_20]OGN79984.1 MAG: FAD dependent oxidoreductase [Chloroflexi bacterium GWC2_49_37]OGN85480.1 MAG: FAD dependent oxidoreductase [Chloroflexi bacterium GWD2_49_16]